MPTISVEQIIKTLNLQPLEMEGGFFAETYRSADSVPAEALPGRYPRQPRSFGTAIYYLLTDQPDSFSALHRLPTDEVWHFYLGDPLEILLLEPGGASRRILLGQDILSGQQVQAVVPQGMWQGARLLPGGTFALAGTTMVPGFVPEDFEAGDQAELLARYPHESASIIALTRT